MPYSQDDGNLVVLVQGEPVWQTGTNGNAGAYMSIADDNTFSVNSNDSSTAIWKSSSTLQRGFTLVAPADITSPDGMYKISLASNGTLIGHKTGVTEPLWTAGSASNASRIEMIMEAGGNLTIHATGELTALYATDTSSAEPTYLNLFKSGALCVVVARTGVQLKCIAEGSTVPAPPADTDTQLYTLAMSSVLSNLAVADFNSTAFTAAVTTTIAAAAYSTSGVAVVVELNGVTATTGSRRLQAAATSSSTSVAYTVQHVNGSTTATGMQALLTSSTGNTALLNSYTANTPATAAVSSISTTARNNPQKEPKRTSRKKRSLSDALIGVIAGLSVIAVAVPVWCKRKALLSKCGGSKQQQKQLPEPRLPTESLESVGEPGTRPFRRGATVKESAFPRRPPGPYDRSPISTVHLGTTQSTAPTPVAGSSTRGVRPAVTPVNNAAGYNTNSVFSSNVGGGNRSAYNSTAYNSTAYNSTAYSSSAYSSSAGGGTASAASSARTVVAATGGARSTRSTARFMQSLSTATSSITKSVKNFAQSHNGQRAGVLWDGIELFSTAAEIGDNLTTIVEWAQDIKSTLDTLAQHLYKDPALLASANTALMDKVEAVLTELIRLATRHSRNGMLMDFALSRSTQSLVDDASKCLNEALAKLQLGLSVALIGATLSIKEDTTVLLRCVYTANCYQSLADTLRQQHALRMYSTRKSSLLLLIVTTVHLCSTA
eukprot:8483-Heterococcus_DN1.PRE.3